MTLLAQLSDTHVLDPASDETRYVDNNGRLTQAVNALNAESVPPVAVLMTGDLVNWGSQPEYDELVSLLAPLRSPVLALPGNHDDRSRIRAAFPDTPWADTSHASWHTVVDGVNIIGLDSIIPGAAGGELDPERERWLAETLASTGAGPTLLALHHPPFPTGIAWMDQGGFGGADRLAALLADHGGVDRIVCGHLHRPISSVVAGIPAQVGLSTVQHVGLDLDPDAGVTLINDPGGYMLHQFSGGTWVTHTRYIAPEAQPYTPDWA